MLLKAAEKCFDQWGLQRTTMDDIATAAGVSRMTLYRYFDDRDALVSAIVASRSARFVGKVRAVLDQQASFEDKLVEGMIFLAESGRNDQFIGMLLRSETFDFTNKILFNENGSGVAFASAVWNPVFDQAVESGELAADFNREPAYIWLTSVNFMMIAWFDRPGADPAYYRDLVRTFVVPAFKLQGSQ
jgi:AcrR family transcriptional regulator